MYIYISVYCVHSLLSRSSVKAYSLPSLPSQPSVTKTEGPWSHGPLALRDESYDGRLWRKATTEGLTEGRDGYFLCSYCPKRRMVASHRVLNFDYARQRPRIVQQNKPLRLLYIFDQSALTWIRQALFGSLSDEVHFNFIAYSFTEWW